MHQFNPLLLSFFTILLTILSTTPLLQAQNSPQDYVDAHNAARAEVGVGDIEWDSTVAAFAENYITGLLSDCYLVHSGTQQYGENLAMATGLTGQAAVDNWIGEKANYDHYSNTCVGGGQCLHYTQVVWRDSLRVGCARAQCVGINKWVVSCNYYPPGNYVGQSPY